MSRICLDTSAYSYFRRGDPAAVKIIGTARWIGIPSIVLGELRTGFSLGSKTIANEDELHQFLQHPLVHILDVDDAAARIYAEIMVVLRKAGTPLPTNDFWIAAIAVREGASLLTYDERFRLIQRTGSIILTR